MQTKNFENFRHEKLDQISLQLIHAKKRLQDVNEARLECLQELSLRRDFICWVREALGGMVHRPGCGGLGCVQMVLRRSSEASGMSLPLTTCRGKEGKVLSASLQSVCASVVSRIHIKTLSCASA